MAKEDLAGFADQKALERNQVKADSFLLGYTHPDHGVNFPVGISDDRHLFIMAGSRAGKGTSMIIPNLLHWQGGVFCIDPKGENASITAIRRGTEKEAKGTGTSIRKFIGQKVAILDPMGAVKGAAKTYRVDYDPLSDINIGNDDEVGQILSLGEAIVMSDNNGESHWTDSARIIFCGIIEAVLHTEKNKANHTLAFCRSIYQRGLSDPFEEEAYDEEGEKKPKRESALDYLRKAPKTNGGLAIDALTLLEDAGEDESGSFSTTLARQLQWLSDPRMQRHLQNNTFSLARAVQENWSIYVCIPPSQIARMKRWMRCLIRTGLDAKMLSKKAHKGHQTLFLLDEFFALGKMSEIENSAAYMAGYGIKLVPVIQNIGQIKELYKKNWETFLGNAGAIIAWGLNDLETEKYVAERIGNILNWEISQSAGSSRAAGHWFNASTNQSKSANLQERPIRRANEIHMDGARETGRAYIIPAASAPFTVMRRNYFEHYKDDQIFEPIEFVESWEEKYGAHT